ncbi:hypothetical protein EG68_01350 [Paragonimus skrjabini miyazakii]|uniref:Rootletin-like coiled-coil domain-containing protein n=1 Tax=Paragonimus skrjabini miyazakii TaxID=59628 RepID=A0A8S9Z2T7_9TREM|nr:hypothetical protein EG68_01350 [Paragonimus skrjabini miyazakii]
MEQHGKRFEGVLKEAAPVTDTSQPTDELSLDRFFHLAGMDPAQLEALCSTEYSEGGSEVLFQSDAEKKYPLERPTTSNHKNTSNTASDQRSRIDESESYRRKLAAYQEGQQKQAQLIQKLQTKVMQYKKRTSDLELEVEQLKSELEASDKVLQTTTENLNNRIEAAESRARTLEQERTYDVEATLSRLQEEQQRVSDLSRANELLRDQLDQAVQANQGLSQDVARLTLAWRHAAQQLDKRETEWREEESAFNDYFAAEHSRLLALWRAVVGLRRQFGDLKQQTDRDLTQARTELVRSTRNIQAVCGNLEINIRANEVQTQANLKRESKYVSTLETEAADRVRIITESLTKSQARLAETESKLSEANAANERLAMQLADRDRILTTMRQLRSGIFQDSLEFKTGKKVSKRTKRLHTESETSGEEPTEELSASEGDDHLKATKQLIEHTHVMHQALSQIAQVGFQSVELLCELLKTCVVSFTNYRHLQK